jgi:CRISPR-associated protein Cmr1
LRVTADPRENPLPYALFPFQGKPPARARPDAEPEKWPALFIESASFVLRIRCPEPLAEDVKTAIWAWVNFGGLGARARRGCGALLCEELAPKDFPGLEGWFRAAAATGTPLRPWPTLPTGFLSHPVADQPIAVWSRLVELWRDFRQGVGFARDPGRQPNRPGRSRYPEPEAIREVCKADRRRSGHRRMDHIPADAFPRAELGLPIVFHFQGEGEPPDTTLYPRVDRQRKDRMASPMILKPLALTDGRAVPLILRLRTPPLTEIELQRSPGDTGKETPLGVWGTHAIHDPRFVDPAYQGSPLQGLTETGSVLEAFLAKAVQNGFKEVKR